MAAVVDKKSLKRGSGSAAAIDGRRVDDRSLRTRSRRTGLLTVAVLLVVVCSLGFALLLSQAGEKTSVLSIREPVAKGQIISRANLVSAQVAGVAGVIETGDASAVVGKIAAVDLVAGQILNRDMVTADPVPAKGSATVGLSLDPSRVPSSGLEPGSVVNVIAVPNGDGGAPIDDLNAPQVLAEGAAVYSVDGSPTEGGGLLVTLVVDAGDSARIAAYSTSKRVAVVETSPADGVE